MLSENVFVLKVTVAECVNDQTVVTVSAVMEYLHQLKVKAL